MVHFWRGSPPLPSLAKKRPSLHRLDSSDDTNVVHRLPHHPCLPLGLKLLNFKNMYMYKVIHKVMEDFLLTPNLLLFQHKLLILKCNFKMAVNKKFSSTTWVTL